MHPNTAVSILLRHGWSRLIDTAQEWTQRGTLPAIVFMPVIPPLLAKWWAVHRTILKTRNPRSTGVFSYVALNLDLFVMATFYELFLLGLYAICARSTDMASAWQIMKESAYFYVLFIAMLVFLAYRTVKGHAAQSQVLAKVGKSKTLGNLLVYRPWVVVFLVRISCC